MEEKDMSIKSRFILVVFCGLLAGCGSSAPTDATWVTKPAGMNSMFPWIMIPKSSLTLAADNTYTFTIPKECFPDTAHLKSGETKALSGAKIDITAQCPSGNCAIILYFAKQ
jgi:hypothetical protein